MYKFPIALFSDLGAVKESFSNAVLAVEKEKLEAEEKVNERLQRGNFC